MLFESYSKTYSVEFNMHATFKLALKVKYKFNYIHSVIKKYHPKTLKNYIAYHICVDNTHYIIYTTNIYLKGLYSILYYIYSKKKLIAQPL